MNQRTRPHVVVLGGGYAGLLAAARVARHGVAQVTLVDQRAEFVRRIRLHELLAGSDVTQVAYAPALARRGITFVQSFVEQIDAARQEVQLSHNAGCVAGYASRHFLDRGYTVTAFDAALPLVAFASQLLQQPVLQLRFDTIHFIGQFDAIWAGASLLHVPRHALPAALRRLARALRPGGLCY